MSTAEEGKWEGGRKEAPDDERMMDDEYQEGEK